MRDALQTMVVMFREAHQVDSPTAYLHVVVHRKFSDAPYDWGPEWFAFVPGVNVTEAVLALVKTCKFGDTLELTYRVQDFELAGTKNHNFIDAVAVPATPLGLAAT